MLNIVLYIWIYGTLFMPYIIGVVLSIIIICLIRKKLIKKNKKIKILIYVIIFIFVVLLSRNLGYSTMLYISAKPDKLYTEMKEINESERLIGLTKEQVIELLGKPRGEENKDVYYYDAGKVTNYLFFGERDFYELRIIFDENNKVKYTSIKEVI